MSTWRKRTREQESPLTWERIKKAPLTSLLGVAIGLVGGSFILSGPETWEDLAAWGYLPGLEIWQGKLWPLWTTAFLHADMFHLFFNLYWLWVFGSHLEPHLGRLKYAALCVVGTFVSSCAQLALSGETGIGLSGLIYAFFGYAWIASRDPQVLSPFISKQTIGLMIGWLFICLLLSWSDTYDVANAAHFAGIAIGVALGWARGRYRAAGWGSAAALLGASVISLLWCPWSSDWLNHRAYVAYEAKQPEVAAAYAAKSLKIDPDDEWANAFKRSLEQEAVIDQMLESARGPGQRASKRQFAEQMMKLGPINVKFSSSAEGVVVPESFKSQPTVVLTFGTPLSTPMVDLLVDDSGMSGTMTFEEQPFHCTVPWSAVTALVLDEERGMAWE